MTQLAETTLRDFGGGWNVSDSDKSLTPRYQPVSDNVVRGTDGHFRVRYGYKLFADFRNGDETVVTALVATITTTSATSVVRINKTAHGYTSGDHITITSFSANINDITVEMMERTHGIYVVDADNFEIYVRGAAGSSGSGSRTLSYVHDTHALSGRTIFGRYYGLYGFVFTENGEIGIFGINGTVSRVWSYKHARDLTVEPWSYCQHVSAEIVRGKMIAVNGALNDKPLVIDGAVVNYLVDASSLSNAAIPRADFVIAAATYVILVNTEYGTTKLEISAKNTTATFSREASPSDAVEYDVGMLTQTVDNDILGASVIRDRVFIGFTDRSMLGTLGIYTEVGGSQVHEPDFKDNIAQFGTFSHRTIISLGNDLFCAGMNGINSLEVSRQSGEFTPQTVSDLLHPVMLRHFNRLSEDDRRYKTFATYDVTSKSYMLFAPKYSDVTAALEEDPVYVTTTLQTSNLIYLRHRNHCLDAGDWIDISGVTDYLTFILGSQINGRRRIRHVIDGDTLVVEVDAYAPGINQSFGGSSVTVKPVNDETIAYVYEYNLRLKIRRWTRFRNLDFDWGMVSQFNKMFFGKNGRVYQFGDTNSPLSADKIGDYTYFEWKNSTAYEVGDRLPDSNGLVYEVQVAHTSPAMGTFAAARIANPTYWAEFLGEPISWELETGWSDFKERKFNKEIEIIGFDTKGTASFTFAVFVNNAKYDFATYELIPVRETEFVAQNTPGFGGGDQPFGGGRNTAQEWLHSMPVTGKLLLLRFSGSSIHPLQVNAATLYYHKSKVMT